MFEYEGGQYTIQDLKAQADKRSMDFEEFMQKMYSKGMTQAKDSSEGQGLNLDMSSQQPFEQEQPGVKINEDDAWYTKTLKVTDDWSAKTIGGFVNYVKGVAEYGGALEISASDWWASNSGETEQEGVDRRANIKEKHSQGLLGLLDPVSNFFEESEIKAEGGITENIKNGNYLEAGRLTVGAALESIPSFISAAYGIGGFTALAISTAGNKWDEEFKNDGEAGSGKLLLNATGSGVIESTFELATRGLLKRAGIINAGGNAKAAKEVIEGGVTKMLANIGLGIGGEGASEASTELTSLLWDKLTLGREINWDEAIYQIADAGIVGSFVGSTTSTFGEYVKSTPKAKERAISILTHPVISKKIKEHADNINKLTGDLAISSKAGKKLIVKKINKEILEIQGLRGRSEQGLLNLNGLEMQQYAANVEQAYELNSILKSEKESDSAKKEAQIELDAFTKSNLHMLDVSSERTLDANLAIAKDADAKIGLEQIIITTDAEFAALPGGESGADGFILDGKVYINREIASKLASVSVGSHELLHGVTTGHLLGSDGLVTKDGVEFIDDMRNRMSSKERAIVEKRIEDNYKYERDSEGKKTRTKDKNEYYDEYLNVFHDAIVKKQITYNPAIEKIGQVFSKMFRTKGFDNVKFNNGKDVYNFVKTYSKDILKNKVSKETIAFAKPTTSKVVKKSLSKDQTNSVNELAEMGWTNKTWKESGADFAIKEMQSNKMLDGLIRSKYKADIVPDNFVDLVYSELVSHVKNFKPEQNDNLFGWVNSQIANKAGNVYNREFKVADEMKGAKDIGKTTKEGEVKVQVAAETDATVTAFESEDLSPAAQAKKKADKAKGKEKVESKFRRQIGIKTGSDLYNKVLDTARKSLLRAYEAGTSVRNIQRKLRDEANVYLFKDIKNFLGTKDYIKRLKEFRVPIMNSIFTADLVQMERNTPESERVFTRFVKKLTSKEDVQAAVDQNLLPASALNIIDKGTAVSLYEKTNPTEAQFMSYFDIPTINPKTGARSGTRGTRKDQLAKNMAGSLSYDATMEVAQEPEIAQKRADLAELRGETLAQDDLQVLASTIGRDVNVKFSKSTADYNNLKSIVKFSQTLTKRQTSRKLLVGLEKLINQEKEASVYKSALIKLKEAAEIGVDLREAMAGNISLSGMVDIDAVIKGVKKLRVKEVREIGHNAFVKLLDGASENEVLSFAKNVFRSTRSAGVLDITTNKLLISEVLDVISNGEFKDQFTLKETSKDSGKFRLLHKGDKVKLYEDVTNIKKNARKNKDLVETVNKQAEEAQAFILKIVKNKKISKADRIAMLQLMAYDQRGALRKASKIGITLNENVKLPVSELVLEHEVTIDDMLDMLIGFVNETKSEADILEMFEKSKVHVLPKGIDAVLSGIKVNGISYKNKGGLERYNHPNVKAYLQELQSKGIITIPIKLSKSKDFSTLHNAVKLSRSTQNPTKGITVLDFDDTLATSKSLIRFTRPDGTKGTLNAEQYASTYENLSELGYKFDFSEFTKVVDGKTAPLFNKAMKLQGKFGPENMFVLTARPMESAGAIHAFLKANGLNIPLKNITGLANSTAEAKALWMAEKVGEGYNDFYFADDALQNVKAVKNMLDQLDVKSKVQQAKVKFSKSMNEKFNDILENVTGIGSEKRFSEIKGRKRGDDKGRFRLFIPPSHEDFVGLLYNFMGKGKEGNKHRDFFEQALVRPINRAYREIDTAKQAVANDYKALNKKFPDIKDKLIKTTPDGDFTFSDAIRVYLWNKHGHKIPGLTETDQAQLTELVQSDTQLQAYAETLNIISKQETYVAPGQAWEMGNIRIDLVDATGRVGRAEYFSEFQENAEVIFSEENLNKIEAGYGKDFREALEDMLHRIKTGVNRPKGASAKPNMFMNWLNASVSGVMFFNTRSALLQQMSNVNYLNFADNNIFKAGLAFANQPQYWKDFAMIFNSDMLKQRRGGLGTDINGAELAEAIKKARPDSMFDQVSIIVGKALKLGFLPTQIGDNIAIATGGAAFYRNRVNKNIKDGMSIKEAENAAFTDFQNITQSTQQSARPDMTSKQQASWIGKLVLNFLNTPSQYNRIIKKAALDIKNRRITGPNTNQTQSDMSNMSRILYYGAAQNLIFYSLQTALFAVMFGDDDEDDDKRAEQFLKKKERVIQGSIDTILRGSGIYGVAVSTLKNMAIKFMEQREKGYNKDESAVALELANFSPVLGIKFRRIVNAEKTINYNGKVIEEMETFDLDNPAWSAVTNYTQSLTGAPLNKIYQKTINLRNASDSQYTALQRILFLSGYTTWSLNLGDTDKMKKIKEDVKSKKKNKSKVKQREVKQRQVK